jgi:phosphoribosylformimino-5-aminoimidazole carboxamide ribotide isomerase
MVVSMILIPVVDLKGGRVVHARGGNRRAYKPVNSLLCVGSAPGDVIDGFLGLYPFSIVYVADIDAIEGNGDNLETVRAFETRFPTIEFWVDCGLCEKSACVRWLDACRSALVLGSESQQSLETAAYVLAGEHKERMVLSLDFRGDEFIGPVKLLQRPETWPERVIVMTLGRIGGDQGPDLNRLRWLIGATPHKRIFAAGGVRRIDDLTALSGLGVSGVLLASALHDGRISCHEIERFGRP